MYWSFEENIAQKIGHQEYNRLSRLMGISKLAAYSAVIEASSLHPFWEQICRKKPSEVYVMLQG